MCLKKYLLLLSGFVLISGYIFYKGYLDGDKSSDIGDAPSHEVEPINLGGVVEEPLNDIMSIGKLQTSYVMYVKGDIDFDTMVEENINNLESVLNYPFNPQKGYLFSVGYDDNSATQFYYQSNQEEFRTVILKVKHRDKRNEVTKIYDGEYLKLVTVDEHNPERLLAYDVENDEFQLEVD